MNAAIEFISCNQNDESDTVRRTKPCRNEDTGPISHMSQGRSPSDVTTWGHVATSLAERRYDMNENDPERPLEPTIKLHCARIIPHGRCNLSQNGRWYTTQDASTSFKISHRGFILSLFVIDGGVYMRDETVDVGRTVRISDDAVDDNLCFQYIIQGH